MGERGKGGTAFWAAVGLFALIIVGALAGSLYFLTAGARARRVPAVPSPSEAPSRSPASTRKFEPPTKPIVPEPSAPAVPAPSPRSFDGNPLAWGSSKGQQIFLQDNLAADQRMALVILGMDYTIQGILFLNDARPVLPSNFLLKDASWGQAHHFGGQDVLLGVVAFKGTYDEPAFRRVAADPAWWKGKTRPAFQMNY